MLLLLFFIWALKNGKIRFLADVGDQLTNKATLTYQNSQGENISVDSNQVVLTITGGAGGANINLKLQGRTNYANTAKLQIFPTGSTSAVFENTNLMLNDNGSTPVDLSLGAGNYDILIKPQYYLAVKLINIPLANFDNLDFGTLRGGDLNNDNIVNGGDFTYLVNKWNGNDAIADINKDGIVSGPDFSVIDANWSMQGN